MMQQTKSNTPDKFGLTSLADINLSHGKYLLPCPFIVALEDGTCTNRAVEGFVARAFRKEECPSIMRVESFELALEKVQSCQGGILYVPDIHVLGRLLTMSTQFELIIEASFVLDNPAIYLARKSGALLPVERKDTCATLGTIAGLVNGIPNRDRLRLVSASSTQEAARMAQVGDVEFAVTNAVGLAASGLDAVCELKPMKILWKSFRYIGESCIANQSN